MAVLYNNGPDPISFVTVLEEDAEGMEAVSCCFVDSYNLLCIIFLFVCDGIKQNES